MDIDDFYIRTGEFGRFQWKAFIGILLVVFFCATEMVQNIFDGAIPVNQTCASNTTLDACDEDCTSIAFPDDNFTSYATEWNMTCGAGAARVQTTQSIYMAGVMTGSFFMGGLGDRYGRLPLLLVAQALCSIFGLASFFSNSWILYVILRFFTGFFLSGIVIASFVLTCELVGPSKRAIIGTMTGCAFASGIATLSFTAWLTQDWRTMSAILGGLGFILAPVVYWFTASAVFYGLTIASGDMGSNRYVSVILNAIVEIPANFIIMFVMNIPRCGRVRSCTFSMIVSSLFCGSIWFIDDNTDFAEVTVVALACSGKFFMVMAFSLIYVQCGELYPTPIRNVGLGVVSISNRIGGILAPQIVSLNNIYHNSHFIVFGVLGCIAGVLCFLLPETLGRPLPETPEDIYRQVKKLDKNVVAMSLGDRQTLLSDMNDDDEEVLMETKA